MKIQEKIMNTEYGSRLKENPFFRHCRPDRRFERGLEPDPLQSVSAQGICGEALDFVMRRQLCDRKLWAKFVEQYRLKSDTPKREWRSEYWGKMMRGAVFVYSATGNERLYAIMEETVRDLLTAQDADGAFSTYAPQAQFTKWDVWGRKYILLGLLFFFHICRDEDLGREILAAAMRHADAVLARIGKDSPEKMQIEQTSVVESGHPIHGAMNSLSILEPMVMLYRETNEKRYLDFAAYLVESGARACGNIFELAYVGRLAPYQYPYTKAYEMMSCFEGLLEYALTVGSEKWKTAAIRFAYSLAESDATIIGSAGTTHEFLDHAAVHQADSGDGGVGQETCVSVTWMKLCARMLLLTGDPLFGDCFEQTLYNAYMGTLNREQICNPERIQKGFLIPGRRVVPTPLPFDSYTPLTGGTRGQGIGGSLLFSDGTYYGCCACIASAGVGIAPHLVILRSENGFSIQLYEKGIYRTETVSGNSISFILETDYPAGDTIRIRVEPEKRERFSLSLRIPSWSVKNRLTVNGTEQPAACGMTRVEREWKAGDIVELHLDMRVEALRPTPFEKDVLRSRIIWKTCDMVPFVVEADAVHQNHAAFRRGPLILAWDGRLNASAGGAAEEEASPYRPSEEPLFLEGTEDRYLPTEEETVSGLPFSAVCRTAVFCDDGRPLFLIDCASAGRTWKEDSAFMIWMRTNAEEKRESGGNDAG